jgi:hypothetical protein
MQIPENERTLPMDGTARALNDRLGLYLSEGQQRGLAAGLLVGTVLASALLAWGIADAVRRRA